MKIQDCIYQATQQLHAVTDVPRLEAEALLAHTLNKERCYLYTSPEIIIDREKINQFNHYLQRRLNKEPLAYITGTKEFWSLELFVTAETLIPRPETELLVESVLEIIPIQQNAKMADLGTGCGAIALALASEYKKAHIYATDINLKALEIAKKNAEKLELKNVSFYQSNWCAGLPVKNLDVIVSNPPYIADNDWMRYEPGLAFEPKSALVSGASGLDAIRAIIQMAKTFLRPKAYLMIEHGFNQAASVQELFSLFGYNYMNLKRDLAGQCRVSIGQHL